MRCDLLDPEEMGEEVVEPPVFSSDEALKFLMICIDPPSKVPGEAGLRALFAVLHRRRFPRHEDAWTHYGSSRQRYYEWKPTIEAAEILLRELSDAAWVDGTEEGEPTHSQDATTSFPGDVHVAGSMHVEGDIAARGLRSRGADFAEEFSIAPGEKLARHQVVGLQKNGVSLRTDSAMCIGVISETPSVLGNALLGKNGGSVPVNWVGWPGQITVLVSGPVTEGDYLIASGNNDGFAICHRESQALGDHIGVAIEVGTTPEGSRFTRVLAGTSSEKKMQSNKSIKAKAETKAEPTKAETATTPAAMLHWGWGWALMIVLLSAWYGAGAYVRKATPPTHLRAMQSFVTQQVASLSASPSQEVDNLILDKYDIYQGGTCVQASSFDKMEEAVKDQLKLRLPTVRLPDMNIVL